MSEPLQSRQRRFLQSAGYAVIVAWGIRTASHILSVILIALLLAYVIRPLPDWLMHRFRLGKGLAHVLTAVFVTIFHLATSVVLIEAGLQLQTKLPIYEQRVGGLLTPQRQQLSVGGKNLGNGVFEVASLLHQRANLFHPFLRDALDALLAVHHERQRPTRMSLPLGAAAVGLSATAVREGERTGQSVRRNLDSTKQSMLALAQAGGGTTFGFVPVHLGVPRLRFIQLFLSPGNLRKVAQQELQSLPGLTGMGRNSWPSPGSRHTPSISERKKRRLIIAIAVVTIVVTLATLWLHFRIPSEIGHTTTPPIDIESFRPQLIWFLSSFVMLTLLQAGYWILLARISQQDRK